MLQFSNMYWRPWRWTIDGWYGAWIGAVLSGLLVMACYWTGAPIYGLFALPSVVIGALVGGRFGSRVVAAESSIGIGLRAGLVATVLGAVLWCVLVAGWTLIFEATSLDIRLEQVAFLIGGVALYAVFLVLPVALPIGVASAATLRRARRHRRAGAAGLAGLTIATVAFVVVSLMDVINQGC